MSGFQDETMKSAKKQENMTYSQQKSTETFPEETDIELTRQRLYVACVQRAKGRHEKRAKGKENNFQSNRENQ